MAAAAGVDLLVARGGGGAAGGAAGPTVMGIIANSYSLATASFSSGIIAITGIIFLRFFVKETLEKNNSKTEN